MNKIILIFMPAFSLAQLNDKFLVEFNLDFVSDLEYTKKDVNSFLRTCILVIMKRQKLKMVSILVLVINIFLLSSVNQI